MFKNTQELRTETVWAILIVLSSFSNNSGEGMNKLFNCVFSDNKTNSLSHNFGLNSDLITGFICHKENRTWYLVKQTLCTSSHQLNLRKLGIFQKISKVSGAQYPVALPEVHF